MDECNELLQDLAVNYRKEGLYQKYLDPVMNWRRNYPKNMRKRNWWKPGRIFIGNFVYMKTFSGAFLPMKVYSDLLTPEGDLEDALVHMQWIGMEYATIRQAVFLRWQKEGRKALPYETLRDYMVVISRMTGYEEERYPNILRTVLRNCSGDWGYFALITGKMNL